MTDHLAAVLEHLGFEERPQQRALYEHLVATTPRGTVVQAGTGTGKSIGVLAAAATHVQADLEHRPAVVVSPTNILLDQYVKKDGPAVGEALGLVVRGLKGRQRYACTAAPAFKDRPSNDIPPEVLRRAHEFGPGGEEPLEVPDAWRQWLGCPGKDGHAPEGFGVPTVCDYEMAKMLCQEADIIITNAHILIIDGRLKEMPPAMRENKETGIKEEVQPAVLPDYCALFVDEAHTLEGVMRDFTESSIPANALEKMGDDGYALRSLLEGWNREAFATTRYPKARTVVPDARLVEALRSAADWERPRRIEGMTHVVAAADGAQDILTADEAGVYVDRHAVLWFEPAAHPKQPRLKSTQINLSGMGASLLTRVPTGLVSATVPQTLRWALGLREAAYHDVGHPFDYRRQATIGYSRHSGAYRAASEPTNLTDRAAEVDRLVRMAGGGALLLFSAYRDLEAVYDVIGPSLQRDGFRVLRQRPDDDKAYLGDAFKADGNAVLFGSDSFATGFDCPGNALRLVNIWKLPYASPDPVVTAIQEQNRQRYMDMMLVKVVQGVGRLIRTTSDVGAVYISDSRAERVLSGSTDPMLAHLQDYRRWDG